MTPWHHLRAARTILANIGPDDLHPRWCINDPQGEDRFKLTGEPVGALHNERIKHVIAMAGCTLEQAERESIHRVEGWLAIFNATQTVEQVLNERFGDPNTLGLRMPPNPTSWAYHAEWDRAFRAQFPAERRAAA